MQFKYGIDERPPLKETLLYGLQWFAAAIPILIILGKITGGFHFTDPGDQLLYLQKLIFVMGLASAAQLLWGHGMPLIVGPSTVLIIGILASSGQSNDTIHTAIVGGGLLLAVISMTGLLRHLKRVFTPCVVAVVLLLVAFTLTPTILNLIVSGPGNTVPLTRMIFAFALVLVMFGLHRVLTGIGKSTLIAGAVLAGSILWFWVDPQGMKVSGASSGAPLAGMFRNLTSSVRIDAGVLISFLFCYIALLVNDLGSIESMNALTKSENGERRVKRGVLVTGLSNVASGLLGVIGPVNFSLSPGIIVATGCAARSAMFPAAALLIALSFSPKAIGVISNIPAVVVGSMLIYILSLQISAGLIMAFEGGRFTLADGLVIGLPLLMSLIVTYLPAPVLATFPTALRPIFGNGFIVGVAAALLMEHGLYRR